MVHSLASEATSWQNGWARHRWPGEQQVPQISDLSEEVIINMLQVCPEHDVILMVAGLPRDEDTRSHPSCPSGPFSHVPRVKDYVSKHAVKPFYFVVEGSVHDDTTIRDMNSCLDVLPVRLDTARISAAARERLFWTNAVFAPTPMEKLIFHPFFADLVLEHDATRLDVLDDGATFHRDFPGYLPCSSGFRPAPRPPQRPEGLSSAACLRTDGGSRSSR